MVPALVAELECSPEDCGVMGSNPGQTQAVTTILVVADANKCKNRKECNKFTYTHVSRSISHVVLGH